MLEFLENFLNKYFSKSYIKENIALITIFPLLLGGVWQIFALIKMSLSYLRFFSVSQQISDGLIVLIICIISYLLFIYFKVWIEKSFKDINQSIDKEQYFTKIALYFIIVVVSIYSRKDLYIFFDFINNFEIELIFATILIFGTLIIISFDIIVISSIRFFDIRISSIFLKK